MSSSPAVTKVVILGSTGSIGQQALDIIRRNLDSFRVVGLSSSGQNAELFAQQVNEFSPEYVGISLGTCAQDVQMRVLAHAQEHGFSTGQSVTPEFVIGPDASGILAEVGADVVLNAISGAAGLVPTLHALRSGARLALANKESLIIGGDLVRAIAKPGQIIPVDSEHAALAQCLLAGKKSEVKSLILTASGGPFRGFTAEQLRGVSVEQALAHPTWKMGPLVTINSATMVNKGLEIIEAHLLFGIPLSHIEVVIHPESIVHSMVEFIDGSTIAQASPPDMRIPIAWGLGSPTRIPHAAPPCDWSTASSWNFFPVDHHAFPAITLARIAGEAGGSAPAVFNGADEAAVDLFLKGVIEFTAIVPLIERALQEHVDSGHQPGNGLTLESVQEADAWARVRVHELARN